MTEFRSQRALNSVPGWYRGTTRAERFWAKVDRRADDECWLWTARVTISGYGNFRSRQAHRVAYEILVGEIPEGLTLDHLCRVKTCVNPAHLEPVTILENVRRHWALKTACVNGHPYPENARDNGGGRRRCRICQREQNRAAYARRKEAAR